MMDFFASLWENGQKLVFSLKWNDALDIITVAFILYYCLKLFRRTRTMHLVRGIVLLALISVLVSALDMSTSSYIFSRLFGDIVIVLVILFTPEIRHGIESFGRGDFKRFSLFSKSSELTSEQLRHSVSEIARAAVSMSEDRVGALIVIQGKSPLNEVEPSGSVVDAAVSCAVLENIFFPKAPLHDGAVIIKKNRISSAGCVLPLTNNQMDKHLGTRHRAAVGITENTDCMVVVVSEETGYISVARKGMLNIDITKAELLNELTSFMVPPVKKGREGEDENEE